MIHHSAGPAQHEYATYDVNGAKELRVKLKMGAGELRVGIGTDRLARADFEYNVPEWKPEVSYDGGVLRISQPEGTSKSFGNTKYDWDLRLNRDVATEMDINFGAGEAKLDLGSLNLKRVDVEIGVGSIEMDLRGQPKHDYSVRIRGGVGEATVRLPSDVGIYAEARGGIGEISARGLRQDGSSYFNDAYKKSPVTVKLDIEGGVGSIKLITD